MLCSLPMDREKLPGIGALLVLASVACVLQAGCRRSGARSANPSHLPVVKESLDDIRARMAGLIHVENDRHLISLPEEFDNWRLKALIKLDEIRRREGVDGFKQAAVDKTRSEAAVVDAATGKIAWRAFTCWNPQCIGKGKGGGPVVFVRQWENASIGPDGKVVFRTLTDKELPPPITCPVCGLPDFVRPYDQPEVEIRRRELTAELKKVRQTRSQLKKAGRPIPSDLRAPVDIMRELNELPKLFLLPEPSAR